MSTSSVFSLGECSGPDICRSTIESGPVSGPREWYVVDLLDGLDRLGSDRFCLLNMASNCIVMASRRRLQNGCWRCEQPSPATMLPVDSTNEALHTRYPF